MTGTYGEIPPYEVAIIYTLSDQPLLEAFEAEAVHVLGPRTGVLYEWRKKE